MHSSEPTVAASAGAPCGEPPLPFFARDAAGGIVAIRALPFDALLAAAGAAGVPLDNDRLLTHEPLPPRHDPSVWDLHPSRVADPAALLRLGVRRVASNAVNHAGEIWAIRGAAVLHGPLDGAAVVVRDTIEVLFHETRRRDGLHLEELPPLARTDAGRPVVSAFGHAVGLLVGGSGYTGLVCPIEPYLREHRLTLIDPGEFAERESDEQRRQELNLRIDSFVEDLATTSPYPHSDTLETDR
jgi:hypothetical protein